MKLSTKACLFIIGNVIISFAVGLAARNYLLNPGLKAVEQEHDSAMIERIDTTAQMLRKELQHRIEGLYEVSRHTLLDTPAERVWKEIGNNFALLDSGEQFDFLIISNQDGSLSLVKPGTLHDAVSTPKPSAVDQLTRAALSGLRKAGRDSTSGAIATDDGAFFYAVARGALGRDASAPTLLIAARQLGNGLFSAIGTLSGSRVAAIGQGDYISALTSAGVEPGTRSDDNQLFWTLDDEQGRPLVYLQARTPPRGYDDKLFTPTIFTALAGSIALWSLAIWLINRTIINPVAKVAETLTDIHQQRDYGRRLAYPRRDELGALVDECNTLLREVEQHTSELESLSITDPLTGIGNRRLLTSRLNDLWAIGRREQKAVCAITFDLDYFKQYNDNYGHARGDEALQRFATILKDIFRRTTDVVVRSGGEEFVVIAFDITLADTIKMAEQVLKLLNLKRIKHEHNPIADHLTASAGVATMIPDGNAEPKQLLSQSDQALYQAKSGGRNQVLQYSATNVISFPKAGE